MADRLNALSEYVMEDSGQLPPNLRTKQDLNQLNQFLQQVSHECSGDYLDAAIFAESVNGDLQSRLEFTSIDSNSVESPESSTVSASPSPYPDASELPLPGDTYDDASSGSLYPTLALGNDLVPGSTPEFKAEPDFTPTS